MMGCGLPCIPAYLLSRGRPEPRMPALPRHRSGLTRRGRYGNVRPLRIGYASRPRLSPRLTLGGLASPRKPWACGGCVSRTSLATHASILARAPSTGGRPSGFARCSTLPYRRNKVPAPKPTSWLSGRAHILCHSARTWGPWRAVWAVSLSSAQLSPRALTPPLWGRGIRSSASFGRR